MPDSHEAANAAMRQQALARAGRILIMDPGLRLGGGHHLPFDQALVAEARRRGWRVGVVGHREMSPELVAQRFQPWFRAWTYDQLCDDPIAGWLESHMVATQSLLADLDRLPIEPDDLLFWPSATAAQVQAMAVWAAGRLNRVILGIGYGVGLDRQNAIISSQAVAWRYAFRALAAMAPATAVVSWFEGSIDQHRYIAAPLPVQRVPAAQGGRPVDRRDDGGLVTVGFVGHQRVGKGFLLVPAICQALQAQLGERVRFVVHDSSESDEFAAEWESLEALGVEMVRGALSPEEYTALLARLSVLVAPYNPAAYGSHMSGVVSEAVATALPLVIPAGGDLADVARRYGAGVATFEGWTVEAIVRASAALCLSLPYQAELSLAAAERWNAQNGVGQLFDALEL